MNLSKRLYRYRYCLLLTLPFIIYIIVFNYIPMIGIIGGFQEFNPAKGYLGSPFVGLKYFRQFVTGYHFPLLLRNTLAVSLLKLLFGFPAPIILAVLLSELRFVRVKSVVQTISYLPYFISWVVILGITQRMLSVDGGVINVLLGRLLGTEPIAFMQNAGWVWPLAVITDLWKNIGINSIIYLAALTSVNPELYEAAEIDGASRISRIIHISWPGIRPTVAVLFIFAMGGLMAANFEQMYILGTPATTRLTAEVFDTYIVRAGLLNGNYSLGIAAGFLISIVSFTMLAITNSVIRALGEESLW